MNVEFSFFRALCSLKSRKLLSITIVLSLACTMILPIFLVGVINNSLKYFNGSIPKGIEQIVSVFFEVPMTKTLDTEKTREQISQIDKITLMSMFQTSAKINDNFHIVEVNGHSPDLFDIFDLNIVQGKGGIKDFFNEEDACIISSSLVQEYGNISSLYFKGREWKVWGILHDKTYNNRIIISEKNFIRLGQKASNYIVKWKSENPQEIEKNTEELREFLTKEEKKARIHYVKDYFERPENNNKNFISLFILGSIVIATILLYGFLNIMTMLVSRMETEQYKHRINLYLGASKKDFWWYEFFSLVILMGIAIALDIAVLLYFKEIIQAKLGLYMTLDTNATLVIVVGGLVVISVISFILLRKSLQQNRIYRE